MNLSVSMMELIAITVSMAAVIKVSLANSQRAFFFCMGNFVEALEQETGTADLLYLNGGGCHQSNIVCP
jgi:hypothetical protein